MENDKGYCLCGGHIGNARDYFKKHQTNIAFQSVTPPYRALSEGEMDYMVRDEKRFQFGYIQHADDDKAKCITANISKGVPYNVCVEPIRIGTMPSPDGKLKGGQAMRIYDIDGKSVTLKGQGGGSGAKTGLYAEPLRVPEATSKGYAEINEGECVDMQHLASKTRRGRGMIDKSNCLQSSNEFYEYMGTINAPIYKVENGMITVKGKQYPIKLVDGYYIIRKLTVRECMRLQTVPEWYEFPVSNSQAYKMLGNGWTIEVIKHLIQSALADKQTCNQEITLGDQMNIFDFIDN